MPFKKLIMTRPNCIFCRVFIRGKARKVGEKYFWEDFEELVAKKYAGTPYQKNDLVCGKCHAEIRRRSGKLKGRPVNTAAVGTQEQSTSRSAGHTGSVGLLDSGNIAEEEGLLDAGGTAGIEDLHESADGREGPSSSGSVDGREGLLEGGSLIWSEDQLGVESHLDLESQLDMESQLDLESQLEMESQWEMDSQLERDSQLEMESQSDVSLRVTLSSLGSEVSTGNDSQASVSTNASSIYYLKHIQTCFSTQRKCTVCHSVEGRTRIPKNALLQVWTSKNIFIPVSNRACISHLKNGRFTEEALLLIESNKVGVQMSGKELGEWLLDISHRPVDKRPLSTFCTKSMDSEAYGMLFGLSELNFELLYEEYVANSSMRNSSTRQKRDALAMLLLFFRQNLTQSMIGFLFGCLQTVVSDAIDAVSEVLINTFVPLNLGYDSITRETCIQKHSVGLLHDVLEIPRDRLALNADGTYIYREQPLDAKEQRLLFSGQKKRNLIKIMMLVLPSGRILEAAGPFGANGTNNDSTILKCMTLDSKLLTYMKPGDLFIVDRGCRDVSGELEHLGYEVRMPQLLGKKETQFSTEAANLSRKVTMNRWVVESANGRVKNVFTFFKHTIEGTHGPNLMKYFRIACALLNRFYVSLRKDEAFHLQIAQKVRELEKTANDLKSWVDLRAIEGRLLVVDWQKANEDSIQDFPKLSWDDLKEIFLGVYQLRIGARYITQHINSNGDFSMYLFKHNDEEGNIISAKIQSRFRSNVKHLLWIKYESAGISPKSILGMYCRCQVGARTVGSCGHIAGVVRYLSFDRHQEPAKTRARKPNNIIDAKARILEVQCQDDSDDQE